MTLLAKFKNSLIENYKDAWKWFSVQFTIIVGAILTYISSEPEQFAKLMEILPPWARPILGILITVMGVYLRLKKQGTING